MSDPVLDEARLAAIQAGVAAVKMTKWRTQASFKRNADAEFWVRGDLASATAGHHVAAFLTEGLPALLAHVGVLRADNQRLRDENERLKGEAARAKDGFCTCYPPRHMLDCGLSLHRSLARKERL